MRPLKEVTFELRPEDVQLFQSNGKNVLGRKNKWKLVELLERVIKGTERSPLWLETTE